jgi:replicative superfamily II helicase
LKWSRAYRTPSPLGYEVSHLYGGARVSAVDTELAEEAAVVIATPEKARALLRATPDFFSNMRLIIIDEGPQVVYFPSGVWSTF